MRHRILGRTGLKVSELGLGGHEYRRFLNPSHFPGKRKFEEKVGLEELLETQTQRNKLIKRAIDAGVNYFDTTLVEEAQSLGLALENLGRRRDVYIAAMIVFPFRKLKESPSARRREIVSEEIEERLRLLQTDYIDIVNVHMPEDNYSRERLKITVDVLEYMKHQGKVGSIGVSSHELKFLAELIRKYDCFDSVMVPYNYSLQEAREIIFPLCKALGIGIVVMKPFAWPYYGIPFTHFCPADLKMSCCSPAQISLRWILNSLEVATVAMGINNLAELEENLAVTTKEDKINEEVLKRCLEAAQDPRGKERLGELLEHPATDIRCYAKRALTGG
jgi:aryl-alcohol dehydrogenase-like predicted oxidoreductase